VVESTGNGVLTQVYSSGKLRLAERETRLVELTALPEPASSCRGAGYPSRELYPYLRFGLHIFP